MSISSPAQSTDAATLRLAVAGDVSALERLLLGAYDRTARDIARQIPIALQSKIGVEDVLQETFADAFRAIRTFQLPADEDQAAAAFAGWIDSIARHRLLDQVKAHRTAKRGGGAQPIDGQFAAGDSDRSWSALLDALAVDEHTPSISVARREAASVVRSAVAQLPDAQREVLQLRYLQGLSPAAVAERMGRSEPAIHMLCNRAMRQLKSILGGESQFFTHTA